MCRSDLKAIEIMKFRKNHFSAIPRTVMALICLMCLPAFGGTVTSDFVNGNVVQFDDNGGWTWYSDERTVVDTKRRQNGGRLH